MAERRGPAEEWPDMQVLVGLGEWSMQLQQATARPASPDDCLQRRREGQNGSASQLLAATVSVSEAEAALAAGLAPEKVRLECAAPQGRRHSSAPSAAEPRLLTALRDCAP